MSPTALRRTQLLPKANLQTMATDKATCTTKSWLAGTTLDYFLISAGLGPLFGAPSVRTTGPDELLATHRPVQMLLHIQAAPVYITKLLAPAKLPTSLPTGPPPRVIPAGKKQNGPWTQPDHWQPRLFRTHRWSMQPGRRTTEPTGTLHKPWRRS